MAGLLATKWTAAKNAAVKEDFRLVNWNQNFETLLDNIEEKIEDASENANPSAQDIAEMKQAFTLYQAAGKDYIKKIIEANTKHPQGGKSWLVLHEGLYNIDKLLWEMLKKDSNMQGPWPRLTGFVDKSAFKVTVEQPPENPKLAKQTLSEYNTEGFTRLAAKMHSAGGPAEQAKSLLPGLGTCLPTNHAPVDAMKGHVNVISQLVALFENQIKPATLTAANANNPKTTLDKIKAEWKLLLGVLPTEATPFVKVFLTFIQALEHQLATAKPARPATAAPKK